MDGTYFKFTPVLPSKINTMWIKPLNESSVNLPFNNCFFTICILEISSPENYYVNVTILKLIVARTYSFGCLYDAISIRQYHSNSTLTKCGNYTDPVPRSIYSESSKLWIVLYWYPEYSGINATISLSATKCKRFLFDPCHFLPSCLSIGANCTSYLEDLTKSTKLRLERTPSLDPELYFSLPEGECILLQMGVSKKGRFSKVKAEYLFVTYCQCCVSFISENGKSEIKNIRGMMYYQPGNPFQSFIEVVRTVPCQAENCKRHGMEIRNYEAIALTGAISIHDTLRHVHGLHIKLAWKTFHLNWVEAILIGSHRNASISNFSGFTRDLKPRLNIRALLGMQMESRDMVGTHMVFSIESSKPSNLSTGGYFSGSIMYDRYMVINLLHLCKYL